MDGAIVVYYMRIWQRLLGTFICNHRIWHHCTPYFTLFNSDKYKQVINMKKGRRSEGHKSTKIHKISHQKLFTKPVEMKSILRCHWYAEWANKNVGHWAWIYFTNACNWPSICGKLPEWYIK